MLKTRLSIRAFISTVIAGMVVYILRTQLEVLQEDNSYFILLLFLCIYFILYFSLKRFENK